MLDLYERNAVGCCLHILLDDCNVHDDDAAFCLARAREAGHDDCIRLAELLMAMSPTQRRKLAHAPRRTWANGAPASS